MDCSLDKISNRTNGFDFASLYAVQKYLNDTCAANSDVFYRGTRMLTNAACERIAGIDSGLWTGWTAYPISDIWNRIVVWKLPLLQLLSQFPRPPLGPSVESGIMMHLLGDPIDSVSNVLMTFAICQKRADRAKVVCRDTGTHDKHPAFERTWKGLAMIMVSYDECGLSERIDDLESEYRLMKSKVRFEDEIRHIYEETAGALAADRQTRILPVFLAELFFIGGWVISLIKAASSEPNPTNWVNVEAQSIAISALYLWVTSTVALASVIGASQTEDAIPRILQTFEYNMSAFHGPQNRRPSIQRRLESRWCERSIERAVRGGTYSWRPHRWHTNSHTDCTTRSVVAFSIISIVFVGCSFMISAILSYLVSPRGFSCRHIAEIMVFVSWVASFLMEVVFEKLFRRRLLFWSVFWKDMTFTLITIAIIIVVQCGILNRSTCWSRWGATWVHLPQIPEVKTNLMYFIRHTAPWVVFTALMFHSMFCVVVAWRYKDAVRVFIQRDDGLSNRDWSTRDRKTGKTEAIELRVIEVHGR